jgi:hypothetical protein
MTDDEFERLATLYGFAPSRPLRELLEAAVRAEREACARVCEEMHLLHFAGPWKKQAAAIRARSKE